jgi:DtxR family Mn-dependent transcriptional regulator
VATCGLLPRVEVNVMSHQPAAEVLTRSAEDYLKAIYHLTAQGGAASTNDLAESLNLAPASVSGMLKRLAEQGLVEHEPYRGVTLSPAGRQIALRMLRRHRLIEAYLVAHLGYTWDTVHEEAERLEHAVSDALVEKMAWVLGHPLEDPHGDPIPGPDGSLAEVVYTPLAELEVGESAEIRRVNTSQADRLRYMSAAGLTPGTRVTVVGREPFRGPIRVRLGKREQVVGHDMAMMVLCTGPKPR